MNANTDTSPTFIRTPIPPKTLAAVNRYVNASTQIEAIRLRAINACSDTTIAMSLRRCFVICGQYRTKPKNANENATAIQAFRRDAVAKRKRRRLLGRSNNACGGMKGFTAKCSMICLTDERHASPGTRERFSTSNPLNSRTPVHAIVPRRSRPRTYRSRLPIATKIVAVLIRSNQYRTTSRRVSQQSRTLMLGVAKES